MCPKSLVDFIKAQAPGAKYVLSVCTGSEVLARAGVLNGKRATTNKFSFKRIQEETRDLVVTWVPKARWVVDGNVWSSSGVTAGRPRFPAFTIDARVTVFFSIQVQTWAMRSWSTWSGRSSLRPLEA